MYGRKKMARRHKKADRTLWGYGLRRGVVCFSLHCRRSRRYCGCGRDDKRRAGGLAGTFAARFFGRFCRRFGLLAVDGCGLVDNHGTICALRQNCLCVLVNCRFAVFRFAGRNRVVAFDVQRRPSERNLGDKRIGHLSGGIGAVNRVPAQKLVKKFLLFDVGICKIFFEIIADVKFRNAEFEEVLHNGEFVGFFDSAHLNIAHGGCNLPFGAGCGALFCQQNDIRTAH